MNARSGAGGSTIAEERIRSLAARHASTGRDRARWRSPPPASGVNRSGEPYCSVRLQTLDHGAPVSLYTVSRELDYRSETMVHRVYAHLGQVRHRAAEVEFRITQHLDVRGMRERLESLGLLGTAADRGTGKVNAPHVAK